MADIPNIPGVPRLPSFAPFVNLVLMTADTVSGYGGAQLQPQWGLYNRGRPVITSDTVTAMGFNVEWAISKYPIEGGAFESYDRVDQPFHCHLQFVSGTNNSNRQTLLRSLDAATADGNLTKYDVVTPEVIYSGVNVERINYDRKAATGLGLLIVDVVVQQIREQSNPSQSAKTPSGNAPQENGNVQPVTPSSSDESGFVSAFGSNFSGTAQ